MTSSPAQLHLFKPRQIEDREVSGKKLTTVFPVFEPELRLGKLVSIPNIPGQKVWSAIFV